MVRGSWGIILGEWGLARRHLGWLGLGEKIFCVSGVEWVGLSESEEASGGDFTVW